MDKYIENPKLTYWFGGISILFGIHLIYYPYIFTVAYYEPVKIISSIFTGNWIPWVLVIAGLDKIIGRLIDNKIMRLTGLIILAAMWIFFAIVFTLAYFASPNVNVLLAYVMVVLAFDIAGRSQLK